VAEAAFPPALLDALERDAMHVEDVRKALEELRRRCEQEDIPFAVVGALAMRQHGYARFTEDIDLVTTPEGLNRLHERLVGRGLAPRGPGLRKKLRDTQYRVPIDILVAGEHAGSPESPVVYPAPDAPEFVEAADGIRYARLESLLTFKLASGIWGNRPRDLADVQELIKLNRLDESYADQLPESLRDRFRELVAASRLERDIE
jgi:hypothetical protein